jgi:hypothetical protein
MIRRKAAAAALMINMKVSAFVENPACFDRNG